MAGAGLSAAAIANYAYRAGFRGQALITAVAVALGESGGIPWINGDQSLQSSKWGPSVGLWQIRSLNAERGSGRTRDRLRLGDPSFNAASAYAISGGGSNFSPWTVYRTGKYRQYLGQAQAAVARLKGGDALVSGLAKAPTFSTVGDMGYTGTVDTTSPADRAKSLYGYLGWFVDHPEVGPVILRAAKEGWDQARLQGALVKTRWWQHTSESARQWDALLVMDHATAARRMQETGLSIRLQAEKLGIPLGYPQLFSLTANALRLGWNPQEISLALVAQQRWHPVFALTGGIGDLTAQVAKLASDEYLVPVTTKQAWQWARRIAGGLSTMEAVQQQFRLLASLRFPHLMADIRQGRTPGSIFAPHRNVIAETLEVSPDQVNLLSDPKWAPVTSFRDNKMKRVRAMTITEAGRYARSRPEWAKTDNAWKSVTEAGDAILQIFGEVLR